MRRERRQVSWGAENGFLRQGVREHKGWLWIGAGVIALGAYGFVATLQPDANFGRILAAYGGVFVAGSLVWGMALDGFRPDRYDVTGALAEPPRDSPGSGLSRMWADQPGRPRPIGTSRCFPQSRHSW